jgi:hypothetical protein
MSFVIINQFFKPAPFICDSPSGNPLTNFFISSSRSVMNYHNADITLNNDLTLTGRETLFTKSNKS